MLTCVTDGDGDGNDEEWEEDGESCDGSAADGVSRDPAASDWSRDSAADDVSRDKVAADSLHVTADNVSRDAVATNDWSHDAAADDVSSELAATANTSHNSEDAEGSADWSHNSEGFEVTGHDISFPLAEHMSHIALSETSEESPQLQVPFSRTTFDDQQTAPSGVSGQVPASGLVAAESKIAAMCDNPENIELELSGDWPSENGDAGAKVPAVADHTHQEGLTGQGGVTDEEGWTEEEYTGNTEGDWTEEDEEQEGRGDEIDGGMESEGY